MTIKLSITDDHEMVLKGIASMLSNTTELEVVGLYQNAQETLDQIEDDQPDILFLDINLPDINGIDLSEKLLKKYPELKIIALTNFEDISFVKRMLKKGVHGYLLKNTDKLESRQNTLKYYLINKKSGLGVSYIYIYIHIFCIQSIAPER